MQWSRPHQEKSGELGIVTVEYADTAAGVKGDLLFWGLEGVPGWTDMTGTPIPGIYGPETKYLTGRRATRAGTSNSVAASRVCAGVLAHDIAAVGLSVLNTRIHPMASAIAWGPAIAKVSILTDGIAYTPLIASTAGGGALRDIDLTDTGTYTPMDTLRVCAFLSEPVTPPFTGLARVFMKCL